MQRCQTKRATMASPISAVVLCLAFSSCAGGAMATTGSNAPANVSGAIVPTLKLSTSSPGHVYISDLALNEIVEFPIVNGVVSPNSDAQLTPAFPVGGNDSVTGIAIDPSGNLYVLAASASSSAQLDVYSPGSTGSAAPIGILQVEFASFSVALDANSNIYIATAGGIQVYAPGSTGTATPELTFGTNNYSHMTVSGTTLFAATATAVYVFDNVPSSPVLSQTYCLRPSLKQINRGIAVDPPTLRLFVSQNEDRFHSQEPRIAIWTLGGSRCPSAVERVIEASPTPNGKFGPMGIAFSGTSLFTVDATNHDAYQLDAHRGKQAPIATMKGPLQSPMDILIGP